MRRKPPADGPFVPSRTYLHPERRALYYRPVLFMKRLLFILGLHLALLQGQAATWYVRPLVFSNTWNGNYPAPTSGIYGSQNGTSYGNAWNGLQSVVWGAGGVNTGDTLYICGTNIATFGPSMAPNPSSFLIQLTQSGVTLRGDYPGDAGLIFGGAIDGCNTYTWSGPDANGVYWTQCYGNASYFFNYQIVNGSPVILNLATNTTWVGNNGAFYGVASTSNYVKTVNGTAPATTNLTLSALGWSLQLTNGTSNIVFQALSFYGGWALNQWLNTPDYVNQIAAKSISFTNCTLLQGICINPLPYQDNWNVVGCEIGYAPYGICSYLQSQPRGASGCNVVGNFIHDLGVTNSCGTTNWPDTDSHGVGVQGGSCWLVSGNAISNTGPSIDFWIGTANFQTNNRVCYNFIDWASCMSGSAQSGAGIVFEGSGGPIGLASNNWIYGNIIMNTGLGATASWQGAGIEWALADCCNIYNNTIYNAVEGIQDTNNVSLPLGGTIVNNIIVNPKTNFLYLASGGTPASLTLDYNLFYTNATLAQPFDFGGPITNGAHTVFANPQLVSGSPSVATDVGLQASSPAIQAGTPIAGYIRDYFGTAIPTNRAPSIGAYQYPPPRPPNLNSATPGP
jgi:hypothetical protein